MAFYSDPGFCVSMSYFKFIFSSFFSNQNSIVQVSDTRRKVDNLTDVEAWMAGDGLLFDTLKAFVCFFKGYL